MNSLRIANANLNPDRSATFRALSVGDALDAMITGLEAAGFELEVGSVTPDGFVALAGSSRIPVTVDPDADIPPIAPPREWVPTRATDPATLTRLSRALEYCDDLRRLGEA